MGSELVHFRALKLIEMGTSKQNPRVMKFMGNSIVISWNC
jgi:hypothetical protein